ncbi:ABC transporter permease subunit [Xinfangfangia sp. D13-10-4-6]|uniref:amino acid ABC transporter permease n=1 Tax=Pseudogemmobacter hezensis TaxID=2737662 RepID=UPI001556CD18|nr:ABC transporter permease subunit [Pseudogemmobacter hezensis]NPD16976.1 ABC transporter permease subunit [Pseudogemmobacter hezensis]
MKLSRHTAGRGAISGQRRGISALVSWWDPRPFTQLFVIALILAALWLLGQNILAALARAGISPGFAFLGRAANFQIGEAVIPFSAGDTYLRAIGVGLINTLRVALAGCVLAALLGTALGVLGLMGNPLLTRLVRIYVEVIRNTPLLLQLFFWIALARNLPGPKQAPHLGGVWLSNRGIFVPAPVAENGWALPLALTALVFLAAFALRRFGGLRYVWTGAFVASAGILWASGISLDIPSLQGFNIRGGLSLSPEFAALLLALVVKFSAAIAEIVRAGILSVPEGQREAARAMGLSEWHIMRLVVLPQALRVIVPLTTSVFLDLAKDSSLAVAIGYPDLVSILNTTANTTGQAIEAVLIMAGSFVILNLSVAFLMNRYNARVALRGEHRR